MIAMRTSALRKLLFNAVVVFQISGCTPIPIPIEDPKILDKLSHIKPNMTTAAEVLSILGRPEYVFPHERIWIYQDQAAHVESIITDFVYADYITEVVFDENGIAQRIDTSVRDPIGKNWGVRREICLPSGICERLRVAYEVIRRVLASCSADSHVTNDSAPSDFCYVYLYTEGEYYEVFFSLSTGRFPTIPNFQAVGEFREEIFHWWRLRPGTYNLGYGVVKPEKTYVFECMGGEAVFLRQGFVRKGWLSHLPLVDRVSKAVGREAINSRRLAANRYNPEFFERYGGENW